jgi:hypothetical protein
LWFQFDRDESWWTMEQRLAGLLKFLVSETDKDQGGDDLAGFRSRSSVLDYLEETGGRKYHAQHVNKLINKLRESLSLHDTRQLIFADKQGIRFLVRRAGVEYVQLDKAPYVRSRRRPVRPIFPMSEKANSDNLRMWGGLR